MQTLARTVARNMLATSTVVALCTLSAASASAAGKTPRLAVLYFDNNTANKRLDVLQKGLADMFITDLAAVHGIIVVERDKLQSILEELKLQRSRYFNKRTAVKIGRGLGASHVVSGSFAISGDTIRLDARLIEISSRRVMLGTKVVGKKTAIFQLEQKLVTRFVAAFKAGSSGKSSRPLRSPRRSRTHVPNVKTLVDYSKGLDLIDKGKYRAAALRLAAVAAQAPSFRLAVQRQRELKRRVKRAAVRRVSALSAQAKGLWARARAYVRANKPTSANVNKAKLSLGYQILLGSFQLAALRPLLSSKTPNLLLPGKRRQVLKLTAAHVKSRLALLRGMAAYEKRHTKLLRGGHRYLDRFVRLPAGDEQIARQEKLAYNLSLSTTRVTMKLARFLLNGRAQAGRTHLMMAPPPAVFSRRYEKLGFELLANLVKNADKKAKRNKPMAEYDAIRARQLWGAALLLRGKREKAIAKWQEVLDLYPTSQMYKNIERKIKQQLGLAPNYMTRRLKRYQKALKSCKDMDLRIGFGAISGRRLRLLGLKALSVTLKEIEKACRGKTRRRHIWPYIYKSAALRAAAGGDCKLSEKYMKKALREGLSPRDAAGYRRNYTKCTP